MVKTFASPDRERRRPTIHEVAERVGVSITTVSRALSGHPHVRADVRERVAEAARALGYAPDRLARGLRTRKTGIVAFLGRNITNPVIAGVARAVEQILAREGYLTVVANSGGWPGGDGGLVSLLLERRVDGILGSVEDEDDPRLHEAISEAGVPVVLVDRRIDALPIDSVVADHGHGTEQAARHLVALGHRRIGLITAPTSQWTGRERLRGYRAALADTGLDADSYVRLVTPEVEIAQAAADDLLAMATRPTAVIGGGNRVSVGLLRAAVAAGLRLPDDLSVVGYGAFDLLDTTAPPLAHVCWSVQDVGEAAAQQLLARMRGDEGPPRHRSIPTDFTPGGSVGPAPTWTRPDGAR